MSSSLKKVATQATRFKSAARKLAQHGSDALLPRVFVNDAEQRIFQKPLVSRRVANVIRKEAIQSGTFGSFDKESGIGWDPQWDVATLLQRSRGQGRHRVQLPKKSKRNRNREERALKIEDKMEGMDERMEEIWVERQAKKPAKTFENKYKAMARVK